jgi:hypothetical protein
MESRDHALFFCIRNYVYVKLEFVPHLKTSADSVSVLEVICNLELYSIRDIS